MDGGDAGLPPNDGGPNVDATVSDAGIVCGDIPDGGATCNGTFFQCDDSADCAGQVCCLLVGSNGISGSSCRPSCKTGVPQLCSGTPECAAGTCSVQTCKGYVLGICGTAPTSCN